MRKEYAPTPDFETNWGRRFGIIFASFFRCVERGKKFRSLMAHNKIGGGKR
jgi:hypothetical protein